jgi:hypothetical protein
MTVPRLAQPGRQANPDSAVTLCLGGFHNLRPCNTEIGSAQLRLGNSQPWGSITPRRVPWPHH